MTTVTQMKAETTIGHFFFQLQRNTLGIIQLFPKSNLLLVLETKQSEVTLQWSKFTKMLCSHIGFFLTFTR